MFSDVCVHRTFIIDKISGSKNIMRRVLVATKDGALYMCKPSGLVRRIIHVGQLTHLAHAPDEHGSPAAWVMLRVSKEHDMLFIHVAPPGSVLRHTIGEAFLDFVVKQRVKASGAPLLVAGRPNASMLHEAAMLTTPAHFIKPRATTAGGPNAPVFVPTTMDDCNIMVSADGSGEQRDTPLTRTATITVDAIFMELLKRGIDKHLVAASNPPRIVVRPGDLYEPFQVSQKFFEAFCMAFDRECSLVVVLQSHLPHVTTFRASETFWNFVTRFLRVSRPPNGVLSLLSSDHVVVHVDGDEAAAVTATLLEWNDAVIAWELDVRRRNEIGSVAGIEDPNRKLGGGITTERLLASDAHPVVGIGAAPADGVFWRSLLSELKKQELQQNGAQTAASSTIPSEQRFLSAASTQQQQQQRDNRVDLL